ncbi:MULTISPECIES: phage integrase [Enterobacter]|uniref:Tyrosine-type recombinase/integrase n=1 Tax=Enterobacter intestinihominis TaxID=3133180 RepID=A0ABV1ZAR5_9ENTR|nr:tyrosine-type recombinase/integrase [Enterobacter hormaechei]ELE6492449.1 tyrosine-type recombinase/integrase [Enterobacter kobei]MCU3711243.1 tyrosine-type recombinase/integrase [Enterobacter hormaechei subsp. hoffmannii]EIY1343145.1 tyrosine-type recombinase/integrase [Enterobacter hormaechei]EKU3259974.1 tyrosine-type recombinase/integrase [Enterobacter hormaechei]EKU3313224.1 tyrosine-type recombinase/integrase [Enterobacter hormaechei]
MSVKKLEDGRYEVDVRPRGRDGKRIRRKFDRKAEAHAFERSIIAKFQNHDYLNKPADKRKLSEFIALWWQLIGRNKNYANRRLSAVNCICQDMGDPMLYQLDARCIIDYRAYRLEQGIKASTINHDLFALSGIFKSMAEIDEFHGENPVTSVAALKEPKTEMSYLTQTEVDRLLSICSGDYYRIAILLLATGARWGEAYNLKAENIVGNRVMFTLTKNGERRVVPISDDIARIIKDRESGRLFRVSYKTFRLRMKEAKPNLPDGQAAHALRHTFATHFMMKGGNIIALQRILGHADISQTMVYAHFAPDYLLDAVSYNPLSGMSTLCPHSGGKAGDLRVS